MLSFLLIATIIPWNSIMADAASLDSRVEAAIQWAISIANDDSHGYSQSNRNGPNYDCSSFVSTAFKNGGFSVSGSLNTSSMADAFVKVGFTKYKKGDVIVCEFKQKIPVAAGKYTLSFSCTKYNLNGELEVLNRKYDALLIEVITTKNTVGIIRLDSNIKIHKI